MFSSFECFTFINVSKLWPKQYIHLTIRHLGKKLNTLQILFFYKSNLLRPQSVHDYGGVLFCNCLASCCSFPKSRKDHNILHEEPQKQSVCCVATQEQTLRKTQRNGQYANNLTPSPQTVPMPQSVFSSANSPASHRRAMALLRRSLL